MEWFAPTTPTTTSTTTSTTTPQPESVRYGSAFESTSGEWQGYEPRWSTITSTLITESTTESPGPTFGRESTSEMYEALTSSTPAPYVPSHQVQAFSNLTQEMVDRFVAALNATFSTTEPPRVVSEKSAETREFVSDFIFLIPNSF